MWANFVSLSTIPPRMDNFKYIYSDSVFFGAWLKMTQVLYKAEILYTVLLFSQDELAVCHHSGDGDLSSIFSR